MSQENKELRKFNTQEIKRMHEEMWTRLAPMSEMPVHRKRPKNKSKVTY